MRLRCVAFALLALLAASTAHADDRTHVHVAASALAFHASGRQGNSIDVPTIEYTSGGADLSLAIDHRVLGPVALHLTGFVGVSAPVLMDGRSTAGIAAGAGPGLALRPGADLTLSTSAWLGGTSIGDGSSGWTSTVVGLELRATKAWPVSPDRAVAATAFYRTGVTLEEVGLYDVAQFGIGLEYVFR